MMLSAIHNFRPRHCRSASFTTLPCTPTVAAATSSLRRSRRKLPSLQLRGNNLAVLDDFSPIFPATKSCNVLRLSHRALGAAVSRWAEWTEETVRARGAGERAVRHLLHKTTAGALSRWMEFARESVESRDQLERAEAFAANRTSLSHFRTWAENAAEIADREARVRGMLLKIVRGTLAGALAGWRVRVQEKLALRAQVEHALRFWVHRQLAKAFGNVVEAWAHAKRVRRAARFFLLAELAKAWSQWVAFVRGSKEMAGRMAQAADRWREAVTRRAWMRWHEWSANQIATRQTIMGFLNSMMMRGAVAALYR